MYLYTEVLSLSILEHFRNQLNSYSIYIKNELRERALKYLKHNHLI